MMNPGSPNASPTARPYVLLDDQLAGRGARLFAQPEDVIRCEHPETLDRSLRQMQAALDRGRYLAGFLSFELGYLFEPRLATLLPSSRQAPLIWLGVFPPPTQMTVDQCDRFLAARNETGFHISDFTPALDEERYQLAIDKIQAYIAAGDSYQVNFTFPLDFRFSGSPAALYRYLRQQQRVAHGALIEWEGGSVLSLSPELFFEIDDGRISTRPMKGTARRGATPEEDAALSGRLRQDSKTRAENVMIVDLLRNDLGRVCETGSVRVDELFEVETYRSLHQMTSQISGRLRATTTIVEVLQRLFPCGSITGAPKVRTMEIIRELEQGPRGVYTGAIGAIEPGGNAHFNVAIRSLMLGNDGRGRMGLGSGIVHDSDPSAEYDESLLKARFVIDPEGRATEEPLGLIETMLMQENGDIFLLSEHLDRLQRSAAFFDIAFDRDRTRRRLERLGSPGRLRVRLVLTISGAMRIEQQALSPAATQAPMRFSLPETPLHSSDTLRYHKTTSRAPLDDALKRHRDAYGSEEVLFRNERGELTEGAWNNLFVARGGELLTPPVHCGLLPGTFRRFLLEGGAGEWGFAACREQVLTVEDLESSDGIYFGNSVRGLRKGRRVG